MDKYLAQNLEAYLAHELGQQDHREYEQRLARNPDDREAIAQMAGISELFDSFDMPADSGSGPSPGFERQVLRKIAAQRQPPFWDILFRPRVVRRLVLASCVWLFVLFGATAYQAATAPQVEHSAQSVLAEPPESADYCNVRLGCDIDLNRSTMLATVMYSGGAGR